MKKVPAIVRFNSKVMLESAIQLIKRVSVRPLLDPSHVDAAADSREQGKEMDEFAAPETERISTLITRSLATWSLVAAVWAENATPSRSAAFARARVSRSLSTQ